MLTKQFIKQTLTLISAAFSLVAALAWNSAIQGLIERLYPTSVNGVKSQFLYAVTVTIIAVGITYWIGRIDHKLERSKRS